MIQYGLPPACLLDAEEDDDHQGDGHDDALDEIGGGHRQKTAQHGITDDDDGAHDHSGVIIHAEQAVEQGAHRLEAGGSVGNEENKDEDGGDAGEHVALVPVTQGKEAGDGDGAQLGGIAAQPLCHDEPVQIGAHGQADGSPACVGNAAQVGHAGQAHEQPAAHVRSLRAHGGDDGPQLPPAQVELVGRRAAALTAEVKAHIDHPQKVDDDGCDDAELFRGHCFPSQKYRFRPPAAHTAQSRAKQEWGYHTTAKNRLQYRIGYRLQSIPYMIKIRFLLKDQGKADRRKRD